MVFFTDCSANKLSSNAIHCANQFRKDLIILETTEPHELISNLKAKFVLMKNKDDYDAIMAEVAPLKTNALTPATFHTPE